MVNAVAAGITGVRQVNSRKQGWTGLLKREGADFLAWAREERVLSTKFGLLATALSTMLQGSVLTSRRCS